MRPMGEERDTALFKRNSYREPKPISVSDKKASEVFEKL